MGNTLAPVKLTKNGPWVDLYNATGLAVGTSVSIQSLSASDIDYAISASSPVGDPVPKKILIKGQSKDIPAGAPGLWARSISGASIGVEQVALQAAIENSEGDSIPSAAVQFLDSIQFVGPFGQAVVSGLDSGISLNFAYGVLDTEFDVKPPTLTGDGAANAAARVAEASSASNGSSLIESRDSIRYSNGRGFFAYWTASFNGSGSGVGWAGPHDDDDGFPIRYTVADGKLSFMYLKGGAPTSVTEIDLASLDIDVTKTNIFAVLGGFLGVANPTLLVKKDTWKVAAVIKTEGRIDGTHVNTPAFPIRLKAIDGMTIKSGSWHGGTMGTAGNVQDRGFSYPNQPFGADNLPGTARGSLTLPAAGAPATAFILHSKVLFNSLPNKIKADVVAVNISVRPSVANGTVQAQLVGNPVLDGNEIYADISASSVLEIDDRPGLAANGAYVSGGSVIGKPLNVNYSGGGGVNPQIGGQATETFVDELQLDGIADETLVLLVRDLDSNSVVIDWTMTWIERQI
jgi:hypothetical protein